MTEAHAWRAPERLRTRRPEATALLERVSALTNEVVDPLLLGLIRSAVAALIGNDRLITQNTTTTTRTSDADLDCLAFTEQFVIDVSGIDDAHRESLARHVPADRMRAFVTAIYITEFTQRLELMSRALLGDEQADETAEPLRTSPIALESPADAGLALIDALRDYQDAVMRGTDLDPIITEMVRLRCARTHDCRICKTLRLDDARSAGVDESMTAKVDYYERSDLDERIKIALRVTDGFITRPDTLTIERAAEARAEFTPDQLAEIMLDITKWSTQKIHVALGTDGAERLPIGDAGVSYFAFAEDGRVAGYSAVPSAR